MSADNVIVVKKQDNQFFIWHDFMSILEEHEEHVPPKSARKARSLKKASKIAHKMDREYDTEYGVLMEL